MSRPRIARPLALLLIPLLTLALAAGCGKVDKQKEYAALINNVPLTRAELAAEMKRVSERFYNAAPMAKDQESQLEKQILDIMIGGELLYQASEKEGIRVSDQEVKEEMAKSKQAFPDTKKFKNTFTDKDIKKKIAIDKFIAEKFAKPTVITDEQTKEYYNNNASEFTMPEQVLVSQILIKVGEDASKELKGKAEAKLKEIQAELAKGKDFAELAKKYSDDKASAVNGGIMGFLAKGQADKDIEEAVFGLKQDKTTLVKDKQGYHLLKSLDHKQKKVIPYEEVAEKIRALLKQQEVQKKIDAFIKDAKKQSKIEIMPPPK